MLLTRLGGAISPMVPGNLLPTVKGKITIFNTPVLFKTGVLKIVICPRTGVSACLGPLRSAVLGVGLGMRRRLSRSMAMSGLLINLSGLMNIPLIG